MTVSRKMARITTLNSPEDLKEIIESENYSRLYHSLKRINFSYSSVYKYATTILFAENPSKTKSKAALLSKLMDVSETTIYRWKNSKRKVDIKYAERLSELINFYLYGEEVMGSKEAFSEWLKSPNIHLQNEEPNALLSSLTGIKYLQHLLDKIEYGAPV